MSRPLTSYHKVQRAVSAVIRGNPLFFKAMPQDPFYLNIGPGWNASNAFYNVDYHWRPEVDRCLDITKGLGLRPKSLAGCYSEHCLEHIPVEACATVLKEIRAALVDGGIARIVMPDLETYARRYVQSLDEGTNTMPYHNRSVAGITAPSVPFNVVMRGHGHQYVYDFDTFRALLERAGFTRVTKTSFMHGADPRLLIDQDHRRTESLYIEATR